MWLYVYINRDTFNYTWEDQHWTCPETWIYKIECYWAWAKFWKWWYSSWEFTLTQWDKFSVVVWQSWYDANSTSWSYWFWWWKSTESWAPTTSCWWWLSWVFTGDTEVWPNDAERALIIAWWAWGWVWSSNRRWWNWWWLVWGTWWWTNYWTAWWGWTQTWHWSTWNASENQFSGWNWTLKFWYGWWGWRWWGNWAIWDTSWDDDKWAWGWSWYVKDIASNPVLTQWWWALEWDNWKVLITKIS